MKKIYSVQKKSDKFKAAKKVSLAATFFIKSNSFRILIFFDYSNLTLHSAIVKIKNLTLNTYTKHKVSSMLTPYFTPMG